VSASFAEDAFGLLLIIAFSLMMYVVMDGFDTAVFAELVDE